MTTRRYTFWYVFSLAAALAVCSISAGAEVAWHEDWADATTASELSGKPVLVYVCQPMTRNVVRDKLQVTSQLEACAAMEQTTFQHADVISALGAYEAVAVRADLPANAQFCDRYRVGTRYEAPREDEQAASRVAMPACLFLDCTGAEYYRLYGFYPPEVFLPLLGQVNRVVECRLGLGKRPEDPRLHADLGRLYLEMGRADLAQPLLETAVRLDPEDATGARADAELDLTILSIPDDPEAAGQKLIAYQVSHPGSDRRLEINYYLAVAYLAAGKPSAAEKILLDFTAIPMLLPDDHNLPNVEYGYLVTKGNKQVGFYPVDDLDEVKRRVRTDNEDPGKCTFARKPMNPDYRNPWTERADLLLKQLLDEQAAAEE